MNMQFQCVLNQFVIKILQLETLMLNHIEKKHVFLFIIFCLKWIFKTPKLWDIFWKIAYTDVFFVNNNIDNCIFLINVSFIFLFSQETNRLESLWKCKQILVLLLTGKVTAGIRINFIGRYFWTWTDPIRFEYRLILSILVQHLVKCETYSFNVITIINK